MKNKQTNLAIMSLHRNYMSKEVFNKITPWQSINYMYRNGFSRHTNKLKLLVAKYSHSLGQEHSEKIKPADLLKLEQYYVGTCIWTRAR